MVALQEQEVLKGKMRTQFPSSVVLFLRSNGETPDKYEIVIEIGDKEFSYTIPILKVSDYSLDDIFSKKLYFLLPFHFFVYEKELKNYNSCKKDISKLMTKFDYWMGRLEAVDNQEIPSEVKGSLQQYAYNVLQALTSKYAVLYKEVEEHMGGRVMQYSPVEEMINKAVDKAVEKTKAENANQNAELAFKLKELGRLDELFQASVDAEYRAKLLKELSIA